MSAGSTNIAPRGFLSCTENMFAVAMSESTEFQKFAKTEPGRSALSRIHFEMIDQPNPELDYFSVEQLQTERPFACIWPFDITMTRNSSHTYNKGGTMVVLLECDFADAIADDPSLSLDQSQSQFVNEAAALRWWKNRIGTIVDELANNSINTLHLRALSRLNWWTRNPMKPRDPYFGFYFVAQFGLDDFA